MMGSCDQRGEKMQNPSAESWRRPVAHRAAAALMASSLALSGCASMFDPYLEIDETKLEDKQKKITNDFDKDVEYAKAYRDKYRDALGDEATFHSILGVSLISLGAATLGLGIVGASTTAITVTGLTGAAGFGAGSWLESTPRQRAYVLGHNAISCSIEAVIPLRPDPSAKLEMSFLTALDEVDLKIRDVEIQIGIVQQELDSGRYVGIEEAVKMDLAHARDVLQAAYSARSSGVSLQLEMSNAGRNLKAAVDRINGQVYLAIVDNQQSLASLQAIIGGLGQIYTGLTTVPESAVSSDEDMGGGAGTPANTRALAVASKDPRVFLRFLVADLKLSVRQIADFVNATIATKPVETLKACGVDENSIVAAVSLDPPGPTKFTAGKADKKTYQVKGGTFPYRVYIDQGDVDGLKVTQPQPFGPSFVVELTDKSKEGSHSIVVADAANRQAVLLIKLEK